MRDLGEERTELERDGQVTVRSQLTPGDVARYRDIVNTALPKAYKVELPPGNETYQAAFDQYTNLWQSNHAVHEVTVHAEPEMGDLEFAAGTHRGPIGDEPLSDKADAFYDGCLDDADIARKSTGPMRAGDASFHLGWTRHRANPNVTALDREVMTVIWFADGARVAEPSNDGQELDQLIWLQNLELGELAASDLNPLVGVQ